MNRQGRILRMVCGDEAYERGKYRSTSCATKGKVVCIMHKEDRKKLSQADIVHADSRCKWKLSAF